MQTLTAVGDGNSFKKNVLRGNTCTISATAHSYVEDMTEEVLGAIKKNGINHYKEEYQGPYFDRAWKLTKAEETWVDIGEWEILSPKSGLAAPLK